MILNRTSFTLVRVAFADGEEKDHRQTNLHRRVDLHRRKDLLCLRKGKLRLQTEKSVPR